jgi:hypothetical protein
LIKICPSRQEKNRISRSDVLAKFVYLIEVFGTTTFLDGLFVNSMESQDVVTFLELLNIFKKRAWIKREFLTRNTVFTFDHLMICLVFFFKYHIKVHVYGPDHSTKESLLGLLPWLLSVSLGDRNFRNDSSHSENACVTSENP